MARLRNPYKKIVTWYVPAISDKPLYVRNLLFQFYNTPLTLDERIALHDELVRKEEEEWHANKDWMDFEMRSYRYGRENWPKSEEAAHRALDIHSTVPRGRFSSPF